MNNEDKYVSELYTIESVIAFFFNGHANFIDREVLLALDVVIVEYKRIKNGYDLNPFKSSELVEGLYESIKLACEHLCETTEVDVVIWCLQRIKKSVIFFNKKMGRQGYLTFINEMVIQED